MICVFSSNIDKMNSGIGFDLSTIIQLISSTIAIIVIGFFISWKLTLIMMCLIPFVIVTVQLFSKVFSFESLFDVAIHLFVFESLQSKRRSKNFSHIQRRDKFSKKYSVHCVLFFRSMVVNSSKNGKC